MTGKRFSADRDWFKVVAGPGGTMQLDVRGQGTGQGTGQGALSDSQIELYDASGRLVASDGDASLTFVGAAGQTYYVVVRSAAQAEGTYLLEVSGAAGASADGWVV